MLPWLMMPLLWLPLALPKRYLRALKSASLMAQFHRLQFLDTLKKPVDKSALRTALSKVEDLDMAAAITQMQKQMVSLEAAQASFAKVSQLNLFNYIK